MDAENNPENPEQEIELLEDDFVEVVDLDVEEEAEEGTTIKPCPNGKCLATKRDQTLFGDKTFSRLDTLFGVVGSCLILFGCV